MTNKSFRFSACFASLCGMGTFFGVFFGLHAPSFSVTPLASLGAELTNEAWGREQLVDIASISEKTKTEDLTFVYIMDCSDSPRAGMEGEPPWLLDTLRSLERHSFPVSNTLKAAERATGPRPQVVAKAAIFTLLEQAVAAYDPPPDGSDYSFAIWTVCREAAKRYPQHGIRAALSRPEVDAAMEVLDKFDWRVSAGDTELLPLFERVVAVYVSEREPYLGKGTPPNTVISMVSDYLDSPMGGGEGEARRRQRLFAALERTAQGRTQLNMITIGEERLEAEVLTYLKDNTDWGRFVSFDVFRDLPAVARRMVYPIHELEPLRLVYDSSIGGEGRGSLQFGPGTELELELPLSESIDGVFIYGPRPRQRAGKEQEYGGGSRLYPNRGAHLLEVRSNDIVDLTYLGDVPEGRHLLRMLVDADRRTYVTRIQFVPRIPRFSAVVMWLLYYGAASLTAIVVVAVFVRALSWGSGVMFRRDPEGRWTFSWPKLFGRWT